MMLFNAVLSTTVLQAENFCPDIPQACGTCPKVTELKGWNSDCKAPYILADAAGLFSVADAEVYQTLCNETGATQTKTIETMFKALQTANPVFKEAVSQECYNVFIAQTCTITKDKKLDGAKVGDCGEDLADTIFDLTFNFDMLYVMPIQKCANESATKSEKEAAAYFETCANKTFEMINDLSEEFDCLDKYPQYQAVFQGCASNSGDTITNTLSTTTSNLAGLAGKITVPAGTSDAVTKVLEKTISDTTKKVTEDATKAIEEKGKELDPTTTTKKGDVTTTNSTGGNGASHVSVVGVAMVALSGVAMLAF